MKFFSLLFVAFFLVSCSLFLVTSANAVYNPTSVPNNRFGIHIITATRDEASEAARLVNANGDWGYVTVLAEAGDRNEGKWQEFFNELRRRHLIPIIRLATKPIEGGNWERPYDGEEIAWADFFDKLNWPTKNRYIVVYNEPNHGSEWGGSVDPEGYAVVLNKTIEVFKKKSDDFFLLNAGFDASTPNEAPRYLSEEEYLRRMNEAVPGIFDKLDGWASHSYPNPGFIGKPDGRDKGSVRTWEWELSLIGGMGSKKALPVFITETGWKHGEGVSPNTSFPSPATVAQYYKQALDEAWNHPRIIAVTPFVLNYQDAPFDQFSFKKIQKNLTGGPEERQYHEMFYTLADLPKTKGEPEQLEKAKFTKFGIEKDGFTNYLEATSSGIQASLPYGEPYNLILTFKNLGQNIWGDGNEITLNVFGSGEVFSQTRFDLPEGTHVEPQQEVSFQVPTLPLKGGHYQLAFNLYSGNKPLIEGDYPFEIEVKAPVLIDVSASLKWKQDFSGEYILGVLGQLRYALSSNSTRIVLDKTGKSQTLETKYLLPDQEYTFTLEKPYYKPKSISQKITHGENNLNFGVLQPDIRSSLFTPRELWKLLPWSN